MITKKIPTARELKELKLEILVKMSDLAVAGFGLVAALAWNDSIKAIFDKFIPKGGGLVAQLSYAILVTVIVVFVTYRLGKMMTKAKEELEEVKVSENK